MLLLGSSVQHVESFGEAYSGDDGDLTTPAKRSAQDPHPFSALPVRISFFPPPF